MKSEKRTIPRRRFFLSFTWIALIVPVAICHIFAFVFMPYYFGKDLPIHGYARPEFRGIVEAFRRNFKEGFEREGASVAVYHKNHLVVDLWAGYADSRVNTPWTKQTRNILFSTTKPIAALCLAVLVDRGNLKWSDPVVKYWPEFGKHGKENTTIEHVLAHQAGLPYTDVPIEFEDAQNVTSALKKLANSPPVWKPGTATGYHPLTYGWLVEGIVRGADPKHRGVAQFFKEDIAQPFNLDVSIGIEPKDLHRTSHLTNPSFLEYVRDIIVDPRISFMFLLEYIQPEHAPIHKIQKNPDWLPLDREPLAFNIPEIQQLSIPAATGTATARDLARLFSLLIDGRIVRNETLETLKKPTIESWHYEQTVIYPLMKGHGFLYEYHQTKTGKYVFGHPGWGCQALYIDAENDLVLAYISNGLKSATSCLCLPYQRLLHKTYESISV